MKPGPRPKPARLKELLGKPGRRPVAPTVEPKAPVGPWPAWMEADAVAREEWVRISAALTATKIGGDLDRGALEVLCHAYARWREAATRVRKKGGMVMTTKQSKYRQISPWVTAEHKYAELYRKMCLEFGLTPASRLPGEKGDGEPEDQDEKFLRGEGAPKDHGRQETRPFHA